jgi:hypothetical protein
MIPLPRKNARRLAAGDVVVTKVARHYHIGRVQAAGTVLAALSVENRRDDALALACESVTGHQRVYLNISAGSRQHVEINCTKHLD